MHGTANPGTPVRIWYASPMKLTDIHGYPLELYKDRPIKNFFRIAGMFIIGRINIVRDKNFKWVKVKDGYRHVNEIKQYSVERTNTW